MKKTAKKRVYRKKSTFWDKDFPKITQPEKNSYPIVSDKDDSDLIPLVIMALTLKEKGWKTSDIVSIINTIHKVWSNEKEG